MDFKNLQDSIVDTLYSNTSCKKCGQFLKIERTFNNIVALDVEATKQTIKKASIQDVTKTLLLGGDIYSLKGVVEFQHNHFVLHVKRKDHSWECYDDLYDHTLRTDRNTPIFIVLLFFVKERKQIGKFKI